MKTIKQIENLLNSNNVIKEYMTNPLFYNSLIEKIDEVKQKKILSILLKNFFKENKLNEFFININVNLLKKHKSIIINNKKVLNYLLFNFIDLFIEIFYDYYDININYELLIQEIVNNKIKLFKENKNLSKKTLLMLLKYSSIEYLKDKKIGYTRINFNNLFDKETKKFFLKELIQIYYSSNHETKQEILNYLFFMKDIIYIYSDITFELLDLISKFNIQYYSISSTIEYKNILYYIFLYILSLSTFKEIEYFLYEEDEKKYIKEFNILFIKNNILLKDYFFIGNNKEKNIYFNDFFEIFYTVKLLNKNYIIFNKENKIIKVIDYLIENDNNIIIGNINKFNKKIIKDIENEIISFEQFIVSFWSKEFLTFFKTYEKLINKYLREKYPDTKIDNLITKL